MDPNKLAFEVTAEEIMPLKEELTSLHARELFEKYIYFRQTGKLAGDIVEVLKELDSQEEEHAYILKILLDKANLPVKEYSQEELVKIVDYPLEDAVKYDIKQEKISTDAYKEAIAKSNGKIKQILEYILQEEFKHIALLESFMEENV